MPLPSFEEANKLPDIYEILIAQIHAGKIKAGDIDKATAMDLAEHLTAAIFEGYGMDFAGVDYNTPDYNMLASLERNVYSFSTAKNYQEIKALTLALKDGATVRSFAEFRKEAVKVLDKFVGSWLRSEYDTAIAGSQMAARWVEYEQNAQDMPWLQYDTVGDSAVRPAHRVLDGVRKRINDPFWDEYYPPNGWNCRCSVKQLTGIHTATPDEEIEKPFVPKMFRVNLAKQGAVFPEGHPYNEGLPENIERHTIRLQAEGVRKWAKENLLDLTADHVRLEGISFTSSGIKEALNQPHKFQFEKNQAIYRIRELIAESKYVKQVPDGKGRPLSWHYLETTIGNEKSWLVVREDEKMRTKTFYTIVDHIK